MVRWSWVIVIALRLMWGVVMVTPMSLEEGNAARDTPHIEETMDDWWQDAEEVDLTLPSPSQTYLRDEEYFDVDLDEFEDLFTSNDSWFWEMECEEFAGSLSPPDFEWSIPPPPLPPFLWELENLMMERSDPEREEADVIKVSNEIVGESELCLLCEWANAGNETLDFWTRRKGSDHEIGGAMIVALVGVALLSAVAGAAFTSALLKCNKMKLTANGREMRSLFFGKRSFKCSSNLQGRETRNQEGHLKEENGNVSNVSRGRWPINFWRKSSSQAALHPRSSVSEHSYSEDPYVNGDGIYAELNNGDQMHRGGQLSPSNTYSEIRDPVRPSELNICSRLCGQEGTYENAGYVLSETPSEPNESSLGSTSTPSSAYYSDVSSCEVRSSKKKKKKRKGEERSPPQLVQPFSNTTNCQPTSSLPVISNQIALRPVHLNISSSSVQPHCCHVQRDPPKMVFQLQSRNNHQTERNIFDDDISTGLHRYPNFPLQPSNLHLNLQGSNGIPPFSFRFPISSPFSQYDDELLIRQMNINTLHRPLPPLPSRQTIGPRRKTDLQILQEQQTSNTLPTEYI